MDEFNELIGGSSIEKLCVFYRGIIIQCVVNTEELIDFFLMEYYLRPANPNLMNREAVNILNEFRNKQNEFLHTILEKEQFNLTFKTNALLFLFNKHCKEYLDSHPNFKPYLIELIETRNTFAHRKLDESLSNIGKKEVTLIYHTTEKQKPKSELESMNPDKLKIFLDKYRDANNWLIECGNVLVKLYRQPDVSNI